jgi:hypothetical protein
LKRPVGQLADANRPITRREVAGLLAATATEQTENEAVPVSVQASYAGVYGAPGHSNLTVVFEDNKLFARAGDDAWFRVYPASVSEFFATESATRWTFVKSPEGRVREVVARSGSAEIRRRRIP